MPTIIADYVDEIGGLWGIWRVEGLDRAISLGNSRKKSSGAGGGVEVDPPFARKSEGWGHPDNDADDAAVTLQ